MLRMTEGQFALFNKPKREPGKPRKQLPKRKAEDGPENIVAKQIKDFLEVNGWTVIRQHSGLFQRRYGPGANKPGEGEHTPMIRIGEVGLPDYRMEKKAAGLLFYVAHYETKAPGKKPGPDQLEWIRRRTATGTIAAWFDGFTTGRSPFIPWYRKTYQPDLPETIDEQKAKREEEDW